MEDISSQLKVKEHFSLRNKGGYIFLDVNALNVYTLDEIENSIIKALNKSTCATVLNTLAEKYGSSVVEAKIDQLQANGILEKNEVKHGGNAKTFTYDKDSASVINAIDIFISQDCNLACRYCFAKSNSNQGNSGLMTLETGEKTVDFLIRRSGEKKDLFICFFGGEPLLNYKVLKHIVIYALDEGKKNNKYFHFSLTTNGTLLRDEIIEFIQRHKIKVLISIDGDAKSHDVNRPLPGGGGSYIKVAVNLKKFILRNIDYSARATITTFTKNKIAENFEHLISLGFRRIRFEVAFAPEGNIFINEKDFNEIKDQYSIISKKVSRNIILKRPFNLKALPLPLDRIATDKPGSYSCTAGKGFVSVDVNGDIYLCHRLVRKEDFYIGNVIDNTFDNKWPEIISNEMNIESRKKCSKCWARNICGGGCYAINYDFNRDISIPPQIYCDLMKHSIKLAITVYVTAMRQKEV